MQREMPISQESTITQETHSPRCRKNSILHGTVFAALGLGVVILILWYFLPISLIPDHTSIERPSNKYQDISLSNQSESRVDILQAALAYVATTPGYLSAYYATGRPNDGYGVCTDVVDQALFAVGIDLQREISTDYAKNPDSYPRIKQPDPNIDFRRVLNQKVWFERHAKSLTTDTSQIQQWLAGDIVVFTNHVGIVSDRRMSDGVPYLIHHDSRWQRTYEDNVLHRRTDIVGHYRILQTK